MTWNSPPLRHAYITGGSKGLGKEVAKLLAAEGTNITIFARNQTTIDLAIEEIRVLCKSKDQFVRGVSADLRDYDSVSQAFECYPQELPDALFCIAGGSTDEFGFLADVAPAAIEKAMNNNYIPSAFSAHAMLRLWLRNNHAHDESKKTPQRRARRTLVFLSSTAILVGVPGYTAYAPAKCAIRSIADTLRQEVMQYCSKDFEYRVHLGIPSNFATELFAIEQKHKPVATKIIEGTDGDEDKIYQKLPTAADIAKKLLKGISRGDFAVCCDYETELLLANMRGPTPKRGFGFLDSLYGLVAAIVWPFVMWWMDSHWRKAAASATT